MKKKRIILFTIVISLFIAGYLIGMPLYEKAKEEAFDEAVMAQYGEENYLGKMEENIELLTQEEVQELNPSQKYDASEIYGNLWGRFNREPITNVYEAREVVYAARKMLGVTNTPDAFLYGEENSDFTGKAYTLLQFYKGVRVAEGLIIVDLDSEGNTDLIHNSYVPEEMLEIDIESVVPDLNQEEAKKLLEEKYGEQNWDKIQVQLYISKTSNNEEESKYVLFWRAEVKRYGDPYDVWMDANTGEILEEYSLIMCG